MKVDADQVAAFRVRRHGLAEREPASRLLAAAGACGVQDTPPGGAALSLLARLDALRPADVEGALLHEKSLVKVWSVRQAPCVVPAEDLPAFTLGLLPGDEASARAFIAGASRHLETLGLDAIEIADHTAEALLAVLDGRALTKDELGEALAAKVAPRLSGRQTARWDESDEFGRMGVTVVRYALGLVSLRGLVCFGSPSERGETLARTDQWLGRPLQEARPDGARRELLRRYLRCYGPSRPRLFAEWAGVSAEQAAATWALLAEEETVEVRVAGATARLLAEDAEELSSAERPEGVRLLPAHDPYLQARDRALLVSEPRMQKRLWRASGSPGAVMADGRISGTWRMRKRGKRLEVAIEWFATPPKRVREVVALEAARLAPFRGVDVVAVDAG